MFKSSKKSVAAAICVMAAVVGTGVTAYAAPVHEGDASLMVTYDNRSVIDVNENGQWGVVIPTSIGFSQDNKEKEVEVEIVGINGYTLYDFESLEVEVTVRSLNEYELIKQGANEVAKYELTLDGQKFTGSGSERLENILGIGNGLAPKAQGLASLTVEPSEKGQYVDELVFGFSGTSVLK